MEFRSEIDARVAEKMLSYPLLGDDIAETWKLKLNREFDMTNDSNLFYPESAHGRLPLYEGKMVSHFNHQLSEPRYWVDEKEARKALLGKVTDLGSKLDYQEHRLGIRAVASSTNERSMIASVIPENVFCGNSLLVNKKGFNHRQELLFLTGLLDSYVVDWLLKQKVSQNINMFYIYQLPIPRLTIGDPFFQPIVDRVARLICTTPEFDELAKAAGLGGYQDGVTDLTERARLRAELDGIVARLYHLTDEEFTHILSAFPLVSDKAKQDALEAFLNLSPDIEITVLIANGETDQVEFKQAAFRNPFTGKKDDKLKLNIIETVAAFMNTSGGSLLIGLTDTGKVEGVELEYAEANAKKNNWDGYQLGLADILKDWLKIPTPFAYYKISAHLVAGKTICRIEVQPAPEAVYVEDRFYIRDGNRHRELRGADLVKYVTEHWKK
jgi:hypothetical protein